MFCILNELLLSFWTLRFQHSELTKILVQFYQFCFHFRLKSQTALLRIGISLEPFLFRNIIRSTMPTVQGILSYIGTHSSQLNQREMEALLDWPTCNSFLSLFHRIPSRALLPSKEEGAFSWIKKAKITQSQFVITHLATVEPIQEGQFSG